MMLPGKVVYFFFEIQRFPLLSVLDNFCISFIQRFLFVQRLVGLYCGCEYDAMSDVIIIYIL